MGNNLHSNNKIDERNSRPERKAFMLKSSWAAWARDLRLNLELTQKELAKLAGVSAKAVDLFEHGLPLTLGEKRQILAELYTRRINKYW